MSTNRIFGPDSYLIGIIACPRCKGTISLVEDYTELHCANCKIAYPIRDGVPVLRSEEATPL